VRRKIEKAENAFTLKSAMRDIQHTVFNMLAQGVGAEQLTRFISTLNDAITDRVLRLNLTKHDLKDIQWTWLAFGSEGREEQTLSTDQDNGIVYLTGTGHQGPQRASHGFCSGREQGSGYGWISALPRRDHGQQSQVVHDT